jgi:hypothetical protein
MPVTVPPGRPILATRPVPTGSPTMANTIGVAGIASRAAITAAGPAVTTTSTLSRTNSATIAARRSLRPSVQRYSIATVRPSIQESSLRRRTKAAVHWLQTAGVVTPKNPMMGSLVGCADAPTGHAATAPPSSVMNARRFTRSPRRRLFAERAIHPTRIDLTPP